MLDQYHHYVSIALGYDFIYLFFSLLSFLFFKVQNLTLKSGEVIVSWAQTLKGMQEPYFRPQKYHQAPLSTFQWSPN